MAPKQRHATVSPEEIWVREFVSFYGTSNVTRFFKGAWAEVSLTRVIEALACGSLVASEKRDGPGCECTFAHTSDDDTVEVLVFFESGTMELEILRAWTVVENDDEPNAA